MSFLAPLFLLGGLAVALPVLFHLIRRSVKQKTVFSSLMFLLPSPPRLTRRSRLEHLLLLAARCAVLCLLALGFARPFLKQPVLQAPSEASATRVLVLLDTSGSMRREELWNRARSKAQEYAGKALPADALAFYTFDHRLKRLFGFDEWSATPAGDRAAVARARLDAASPGWGPTMLDRALIEAAEALGELSNDEPNVRKQLVLISDLQDGSQLAGLQGHQWPDGLEVISEQLAPKEPGNAGLQLITEKADAAPTVEPVVRVRISNSSDSKREQFQVGWASARGDAAGSPTGIYVPAGQSRVVTLPTLATNVGVDRVILRGDTEPFDNTVYVMPPGKTELSIVYLGGESEVDSKQPLFYLRRALQDTRLWSFRISVRAPSTPLRADDLAAASVLVATSGLGQTQVAAVGEAVRAGKLLLFAPTSAEAANSLSALLGIDLPAATERTGKDYAMLGTLDFNHPLFSPFADVRFSDFTKIHFWKYRQMHLDGVVQSRSLASFDSGDPALIEFELGKGRVLVLASGWHPSDSQLALSSKFVPLLYSVLELAGAAPRPPQQYFVSSPLPPEVKEAVVERAGGTAVNFQPGGTNLVALEPGIYSIRSGQQTNRFAVNLDPAESRTAPLATGELERFGVPGPRSFDSARNTPAGAARLQNTELESRQKLWRWFILATLGLLALETWLGGWTWRRAATPEEAR